MLVFGEDIESLKRIPCNVIPRLVSTHPAPSLVFAYFHTDLCNTLLSTSLSSLLLPAPLATSAAAVPSLTLTPFNTPLSGRPLTGSIATSEKNASEMTRGVEMGALRSSAVAVAHTSTDELYDLVTTARRSAGGGQGGSRVSGRVRWI